MQKTHIRVLCSIIFMIIAIPSQLQASEPALTFPVLVGKFYTAINQRLYWFGNTVASTNLRAQLLQKLDSAAYYGIERNENKLQQLKEINERNPTDSAALMKQDMQFTDAAITYCKALYQGSGISEWMEFDEWSKKYEDRDNGVILTSLASVTSVKEFAVFIRSLEPAGKEFQALKEELKAQMALNNVSKTRQVSTSLNFYRWVHHFNFGQFIVVNIGAANLRYFVQDTEALYSKMIVGKPSSRTPRFSAKCTQVILYPYWNVPQDIALRELVPKYKKKPSLIDVDNMQVLNAKGVVVDPYALKWSQFSRSYFPYRLRQSTGCDNSLGVIKFDLDSPFDVYLHDTNAKGLFASKNRYRSHGCMRVEKAIELGNYLLNNKLDTAFLQACIKGGKPVAMPLEKPVPVFVVYLTAVPDANGSVTYFDDVYHLLQTK